MTMLEKVAQALHQDWIDNNDHGDNPVDRRAWDELSDESRRYGLGQARAALQAIREPDEAFMLALYPDPSIETADQGRAAGLRSRAAGRRQIAHFIDAILGETE